MIEKLTIKELRLLSRITVRLELPRPINTLENTIHRLFIVHRGDAANEGSFILKRDYNLYKPLRAKGILTIERTQHIGILSPIKAAVYKLKLTKKGLRTVDAHNTLMEL